MESFRRYRDLRMFYPLRKEKPQGETPMSTPRNLRVSVFRLDERRTDLSLVDVSHFIFDKYTSTVFSEIIEILSRISDTYRLSKQKQ